MFENITEGWAQLFINSVGLKCQMLANRRKKWVI